MHPTSSTPRIYYRINPQSPNWLRLLFLCILCGSKAFADDNWPQFRGPTGDGQSTARDLPLRWSETENIAWKTPIHDRGWSSPVIFGGQIWLTTATDDGKKMYAVCVDRDTGQIVHDVLLFENEKPEAIHELNSYASPTPVVEDGRVHVHFGSYGTTCLDTRTADVLWRRRDLPCNHFRGPGSSPIAYCNTIIIHYDGFDYQYLVALDKKTGDTVWRTDRDVAWGNLDGDFKKAYSTPLVIEVDGRRQLISSGSKAAMAYDPDTGKEIWRIAYDGFSSTARPLFGHGLVFINTGFSKADLYAVRPTGKGNVTASHIAWHVTRGIGSKPSPVLVDDLLYQVHDGGVAVALESKTGKEVWTKRLGGAFSASTIVADGKIYFVNQEGVTTVIAPGRECKILATNKLDDGAMASPAAVGKSLYLRTKTHLYRIEKRVASSE